MDQSTAGVVQPEVEHRPVLAALSLLIGMSMALIVVVGMVAGKSQGWKGGVGMLILACVPVCTVATAMAIISLVWRRENKSVAQYALWLNSLLGFFAFPLMVYWLLAMQ
jgi:hypothetical protein